MTYDDLAEKLISAPAGERDRLLEKHRSMCDARLAESLRKSCYEIWTTQPQRVSIVAEILTKLFLIAPTTEVEAHLYWVKALACLVNGELTECLALLDRSELLFRELGLVHSAATTQITRLYALALLGRYDEAIECGRSARKIFVAEDDAYSAGKIEHNIGNLYLRRDLYAEAEPYLKAAHRRFLRLGDHRQTAMLENNLAFTNAAQNHFREAEKIYRRGLNRTRKHGLTSIEADIEANMSNLYLFQGRYGPALEYLESARGKYESLAMPHQNATTELDTADIYLELNLLPEAIDFYKKCETQFARLGMRAELARSFRNHAKALLMSGERDAAAGLLEESVDLFEAEGNKIAAALVELVRAQMFLNGGEAARAEQVTRSAIEVFRDGESVSNQLLATWQLGEILFARGRHDEAESVLRETLQRSANSSRHIEYLCLASLGRCTRDEATLVRAVKLAETLRSALSAEECRAAFLSNRLLPYNELVKLNVDRHNFREAFVWHERSRARTLLESISDPLIDDSKDRELRDLREELNWYYNRINRTSGNGLEARKEVATLSRLAAEREKQHAERLRRLQIKKGFGSGEAESLDVDRLQERLADTTLIEFANIDGKITAFVVTSDTLQVVPNLVDASALATEVNQLLFQIRTGRVLERLSEENRDTAIERMLRHSRNVHRLIIEPLTAFLRRRVVFGPADFLHYLPFQVLHDGKEFLIERHEVSYTPSASIMAAATSNGQTRLKNALLVGVADERTPLVREEVKVLSGLFQRSVVLMDERATLENLRKFVASADVLHLASHGTFRTDNPAFSSMALFEEALTVADARTLELRDKLVVLSACDTGMNKILGGEEIIGLERGFLSAGATGLVLSLWALNDTAAIKLMESFYRHILGGECLGRSLQAAQIELLREQPHPYFWSPFVVIGYR